jgi:hypothetical protein
LADRWKRSRWPTVPTISGTNWTAEAPVPITATRRPVRSWSWFQRAEWKVVPSKESRPGIGGIEGRLSCPNPEITTAARSSSPVVVVRTHSVASWSHTAAAISVPKLVISWSSCLVALARMWARISGCPANVSVQSGLGSNDSV